MAHLHKPDMPAVLERTYLAHTFDAFLLPVYEAGSNAIHSLIDKLGGDKVAAEGKLTFSFSVGTTPSEFSVSIIDNAVGLDEENYEAFLTPFTGNKLKKGGKGFGRFVAFKVFEDVVYVSKSRSESGDIIERAFKFDIYSDEEITPISGGIKPETQTGCAVTYRGVRAGYDHRWAEVTERRVLDHLSSNFLTYLVDGRMPDTTVIIGGKDFDLRSHFKSVFKLEQQHKFTLELRETTYEFQCSVSRVERGKPFTRHALMFFADNRLLGAGRAIENKLGRTSFQRSDGTDYVVIASLSGEFLDKHANQARTALEADETEISEIVDRACQAILATESEQHEQIKRGQRNDVVELLNRHPLLRYGMPGTVGEYVRSKPNNWRQEHFVSDLAIQRLREERRWANFVQKAFEDKELFAERKAELLKRVSETYRDALAEYIVHRKAVIEVADQLRGSNDDGEMNKEDAFHELMFPRQEDSETTKYYRHNLWLLDERLAFVSYISSDRTLHGGRRKAGDKIIDVAFYDECFVAGGDGTNSIMLVEFKRPGREKYSFGVEGEDPIKQIHDTVEQIRQRKSFVTTSKKTIEVPDGTPITAIIVADLEPSLKALARRYDFAETWDKLGLFKYHEEFDVFIEIHGFNKLISNAEKRNAAFFDILLGDLGT